MRSKSQRSDSTDDQSTRLSQTDSTSSRRKLQRVDSTGKAPQNDDYVYSGTSKRGNNRNDHDNSGPRNPRSTHRPPPTNQRYSNNNNRNQNSNRKRDDETHSSTINTSMFSRFKATTTYETFILRSNIYFPSSYNEQEHGIAIEKYFLEDTLPFKTPDKLLLVTHDDKTMEAKNSTAVKVYHQILCQIKTKNDNKNAKSHDMPTIFLSSDTDSKRSEEKIVKPKKKRKVN